MLQELMLWDLIRLKLFSGVFILGSWLKKNPFAVNGESALPENYNYHFPHFTED